MDEEERDEAAERPRPRVVDKRVSARPAPDRAQAPPPEPVAAEPSPPGEQTAVEPPAPPEPQPAAGDQTVWTPAQEEQAQRLAAEIAERPAGEWVLNVAVTLANVAAAKVELGMVEDARIAIDAFAALVNAVGAELGDAETPLKQTLAQLQMAYAESIGKPEPGSGS